MQAQVTKQVEASRGQPTSGGSLGGGQDEPPYMQGYQTTLGQGQGQGPYRKSSSFQDAAPGQQQGRSQEPYRKSASFQDAVSPLNTSRADPSSPANIPGAASAKASRAVPSSSPGAAKTPSSTAEAEQASGRIAAVRPAGYEEAGGQGMTTSEAAGAAVNPPARRAGSLLLKGKRRTGSISVADRLKNVRGLLDTGGEDNFESIQEDLPTPAVDESDGLGKLDDVISEEPQLTQDR